MRETLAAAGAPSAARADIPDIVKACLTCRRWEVPDNKPLNAYRVVLDFNLEVQLDLRFMTEQVLTDALDSMWVDVFGSPELLVVDGEAGMLAAHARDWASSHSITFKFRPPKAKAWVVERESQCTT